MFELRALNMPMVTAVNGAADVGMSFAMMGDIVCARAKRILQALRVSA